MALHDIIYVYFVLCYIMMIIIVIIVIIIIISSSSGGGGSSSSSSIFVIIISFVLGSAVIEGLEVVEECRPAGHIYIYIYTRIHHCACAFNKP